MDLLLWQGSVSLSWSCVMESASLVVALLFMSETVAVGILTSLESMLVTRWSLLDTDSIL